MIKEIRGDIAALINAYKGQGIIFYFGCAYIIFSHLRPQVIYPQLDFLPWTQLTILGSLGLMVLKKQFNFTGTHPLALLEAMALKAPFIAHAIGGIPTVLNQGECGVLISKHQPSAYADAIYKLIKNPGNRNNYSNNAFIQATTFYSSEQKPNMYCSVYRLL